MAQIVLGVGTSHSPMLSTPPQLWRQAGEEDRASDYLVSPETGEPVTYQELLDSRSGQLRTVSEEHFNQQWEACQKAVEALARSLREARPDVLIIISDDQRELLFDDNMPMFQIYWGDSIRLIPRFIPESASNVVREWNWGYGDIEMDLPVDSALGRHLIEHLVAHEFDMAHSRYSRKDHLYGGTIGPAGYLKGAQVTPPKRQGVGHGWGFVVRRLLDNKPIPIVPVMMNTCYPPNVPTAHRCYKLGECIRAAVEAYGPDRRVAVVASGGLSHFVTDEVIDRSLIRGITERDATILCALPERRLQSAASEIKNWIACAAACTHLTPAVIDYIPVYRSPAGTGGGWAFIKWD